MPKTFEYKEAKEQINYYKKLLNDLRKSEVVRHNSLNDLNQQIRILHNYGFFSDLVENGVKGKELKYTNNFNAFIANIYYYIESSKMADVCNDLYKSYGSLVEGYISSLSSGSNAIFWLFSSKKKKSNAEEAYDELVKLRSDSFVTSSVAVLEDITNLKKTDLKIIQQDYAENKNKYRQWLKKSSGTVFTDGGTAPYLKGYEKEYNSIISNLTEIQNSIQESIKEIKDSVDRLLAVELINSLRGIPVDELARDKSGIKTKYLKDAGYDNLADVFGASAMQIASVYGISQDKAYTIKSKCYSYARKLRSELKIKLSIDNKSKEATKVIQAIYVYMKKMGFSKQIEELD